MFDSTCVLILGHGPISHSIGLPDVACEKAFTDADKAILYRHILPESFWKLQRWLQVGKEKNYSKAWETIDLFIAQCISLKHKFLRDNMLNFVFAGRDTTSAALTWFFWLVATNPSVENKIREEIITKLLPKEDNRLRLCFSNVNDQEMKKLVHLHGALCESLWLFPPVSMQHKASLQPDILPSSNNIGANTRMLLGLYSMERMETIWGKDCLEFKPERWIIEQGGIKHEPSYKFVTFNSGPRSCLGKDMTYIQMKIIAIAIIYNHNIQVVDGHAISPSSYVILHMKDGLKVRITKIRV
ncbi:Alkane hydroxylase MAH1 [Camellia lanceoleosa]|uniref:Alkane hydroxylase MAH1 n=1 Tax=Camellia lanceoleosa TaxID=1840588 RepID=A0ACC0FUY9_9ERIC|nr:Alkane hydroxylase MAH1 [Camellia lanceoleosa]